MNGGNAAKMIVIKGEFSIKLDEIQINLNNIVDRLYSQEGDVEVEEIK